MGLQEIPTWPLSRLDYLFFFIQILSQLTCVTSSFGSWNEHLNELCHDFQILIFNTQIYFLDLVVRYRQLHRPVQRDRIPGRDRHRRPHRASRRDRTPRLADKTADGYRGISQSFRSMFEEIARILSFVE
jgi:hypothetical protein